MLSRLSVMDLAGIAGAVGIVGAATCLYAVRKKTSSIMNENYSVSAYKLVQQNRAVMEMIGDPLRTRRLDLTDTINNKFEELSTRVKLPFKGSKRNGNLYVWADRQHSDHEWTVKRLEIIFSDIPDKKVIVYKNESDR